MMTRPLRSKLFVPGARPELFDKALAGDADALSFDLFEPYGIAQRDLANVHAAMFAMRMAAAEAGVFVLDGAFAAIDDSTRFEAEAQMARRLGYLGKSCIHPCQADMAMVDNETAATRNHTSAPRYPSLLEEQQPA